MLTLGSLDDCRVNLQVTVKMNDSDRPIGLVDAAQQWQSDSVVASQGDDTRKSLAGAG